MVGLSDERSSAPPAGISVVSESLITSCPVGCGGRFVETDLALPEGNLLRCADCGQLVSRITSPEYVHSMEEFDTTRGTLPAASSQDRHDQRAHRLFQTITSMIAGGRENPLRLLDIGCSSGALMRSALQYGFDVEGVEPATRAAQTAQAAGLKVTAGYLQAAAYPSESFDAATMMEVIEHLPLAGDLLREAWRILKPAGVLVVGTGNAASWTVTFMGGQWDYFQVGRHGGHISFFNPNSLALLASRCGFRLERIETRHVRFKESYQASTTVYRGLKVLGELLNGPARLLGKGHDMLAFVRKV